MVKKGSVITMIIKNKIIAKLISAILIATLALPSVAFASDENSNNNEFQNYDLPNYQDPDADYKNWTINVEYNQTRARRHADLVNQFRTSDTWQLKPDGTREEIKNLNGLIYDYGLEKCAMKRAAEVVFKMWHSRPNGGDGWYTDVYDNMFGTDSDYPIFGENCAYMSSGIGVVSEEYALNLLEETDCSYEDQGHRRNMLAPQWKYFAIGHVIYQGHHYYVQWFSDKPTGQSYTEPLDSTKSVTVTVDMSIVSEDTDAYFRQGVVIPDGAIDENGNVHRHYSNLDDPNNTDDPKSISDNTIKSTYKTKTDISSLIPTPGAVKAKYKSSSKKIAKVNKKGIVTGGKKAGTATITKYVKYDKKSSWGEAGSITIQNYYPKLPKKQTLSVGSTLSMNSLLTGMDETPIKWESSKPSVATISENGMVIALQKGTAKLTPVFSSGKAKVKTTIKVK